MANAQFGNKRMERDGKKTTAVFSAFSCQSRLEIESRNTPNDDVRIRDQPLYSFRIPHIHERRHCIIVRRRQTLSVR